MPLSTYLDGLSPGIMWLALAETGYVVSGSVASDGGGGVDTVWTQGTVGIPCRIDPAGVGGRGLMGGRIDERSTAVLTLPPTVTLQSSQRFAITGRGTYEITATHERTRQWSQHVEVRHV